MFGCMHHEQLVQKGIDTLTILDDIEHQFFFREWHEGIVDVTHPKKRRLTARQGECIKLDVHVISNEAYRGILRILYVIKAHFDRLDHLRKKANWVGELTHINDKDESWI